MGKSWSLIKCHSSWNGSIEVIIDTWIGMDIREYSSGGKHRRFGITKHGNRYLRTAFIEANQRGYRTARISKAIKARRAHTAPEFIDIADEYQLVLFPE